jgi:hypothetical protein
MRVLADVAYKNARKRMEEEIGAARVRCGPTDPHTHTHAHVHSRIQA